MSSPHLVVFDLDGTLVDSDAALIHPFVALGVPRDEVTFGHVLAEECGRHGLTVDDYIAHYDSTSVLPFPGVEAMLARLDRWAVCSNKLAHAGRVELDQFGWDPEVALFADAFEGSKQLSPVLSALGAHPDQVLFVGDTDHDRQCADLAGVTFGLAGWNARAEPRRGDLVLSSPGEVFEHLS